MKITLSELRQVIREELSKVNEQSEPTAYDLGREDSLAGLRPQLPDEDYMMGYNDAQIDAGLPKMQAPSDSGRGKKLNPDLLKGARPGKHWSKRK